MSIELMGKVWKHPNLHSQSHKLVLLCLADFADDDGFCWPKMSAVATKCSLTRVGVFGILERLEKTGYLTKEHATGKGRPCRYYLHIDRGQEIVCMRGKYERQKDDSVNGMNTLEADLSVNGMVDKCKRDGGLSVNGMNSHKEPPEEPPRNHQVPPNPQGGKVDVPKDIPIEHRWIYIRLLKSCGVRSIVIPPSIIREMRGAVGGLAELGATLELFDEFDRKWKLTFRGEKGRKPGPEEVWSQWDNTLNWTEAVNGNRETDEQRKARKRAERDAEFERLRVEAGHLPDANENAQIVPASR